MGTRTSLLCICVKRIWFCYNVVLCWCMIRRPCYIAVATLYHSHVVRSEVNKVRICRALFHSVLNHCMWDISRELWICDKGRQSRHILNILNVLQQNCDRWSGEWIYAKSMWFTSSQRISLWSYLIRLRLYWCVRFSYSVGSYLWFVSTTLIAFYRRYDR